MTRLTPAGSRAVRSALACVGVVLCALSLAQAQIGTGGRRGGIAGGDGVRFGGSQTEAQRSAAVQRQARTYYSAGQDLLAKGRIQAAKSKFKAVIELVGLEGVGQSALSRLRSIHKEGMARLAEARTLFQEGKYLDAIDLARETSVLYTNIFGGIQGIEQFPNVSRLARKLVAQFEVHPEAIVAIQEYEATKRMKKIDRFERQTKKDRLKYLDLYRALKKVVKHYPDCPTGQQCAKRLKEIKKDKKLFKLIRKEARRRFIAAALQRIEQYEQLGMSKEVAAQREKLRKKFPGKSFEELRRMAEL